MSSAYLSLGTNLGERLEYLRRGVEHLNTASGVRVVQLSSVYETEPVGVYDQPRYLNLVARVSTDLDPHALLGACQAIEHAHGRVRTVRWGPRTLDIDILLYDDLELDTPDLIIPHPRMHERAFVLTPLLEVTPDIMLLGRPAREWLQCVQESEGQGVEWFASTQDWIAEGTRCGE